MCMNGGKAMWAHREKADVCRQEKGCGQTLIILVPWSETSILQTCEKVNVCCLRHNQFAGFWYGIPNQQRSDIKQTCSLPILAPGTCPSWHGSQSVSLLHTAFLLRRRAGTQALSQVVCLSCSFPASGRQCQAQVSEQHTLTEQK